VTALSYQQERSSLSYMLSIEPLQHLACMRHLHRNVNINWEQSQDLIPSKWHFIAKP